MEEVVATLARTHRFRWLPREALRRLVDAARIVHVPAGSYLMHQHDIWPRIYIIISGTIRIERFHQHLTESVVLAERTVGDVAGNWEIFGAESSQNAAKAVQATEALMLDGQSLAPVIAEFPDLLAALQEDAGGLGLRGGRLRGFDG
jgi:CRP-like cAMP-binding protein